MAKLSDTFVRQLAPGPKLQTVYDDDVSGFGLRVTPSGTKSFVLRYRNQHGRERLITIGRFDVWTTGPARTEAKRLLREQVNIGVDPLADRQEARQALTVNELLDLYVESARFKAKADTTQSIDKGRFDRHIRPLLGKELLADLTMGRIEKAFADISEGKTAARVKTKPHGLARVRGGAGTARRAIRLFRAALSWGVREGHLSTNPASGIDVGRDGVRKLILDADGYTATFKALAELESEGTIKAIEADAIRLIALTGARRGEIAHLPPEHIYLAESRIIIPPAKHKTGKATGDERIIDLVDEAVDILKGYPAGIRIDVARLTEAWVAVRTKANLPNDFGMHGLRHSVASHLAMDGAEAAQIMTALGHKRMETSQRYIHWARDARKDLARRAAGPALAGMKAKS